MIGNREFFAGKSREIRKLTIESIGNLGVGHIGGCLSVVDVLTVLYYSVMNIDPKKPHMEGRDRLVLSKGHAGPALYAILADKGFFPKEELFTLNRVGTNLPSHCDMLKTPGIDMTTGALGQGFSCAVGIAIGSKIKKDSATVYAIIGDGESQEGQVWEAAMYAGHRKLDNLIAFTDYNKLQIDGPTEKINSLGDLRAKWESFGWFVQKIDGHDHLAIYAAIERAKNNGRGGPAMIILDTIKGKGVSFVEAAGVNNHNMPITLEQVQIALDELG